MSVLQAAFRTLVPQLSKTLISTAKTVSFCRPLSASAVVDTLPLIHHQKKRGAKKKYVNPNILAYATCEEYNTEDILRGLEEQGLYVSKELPEESEALYAVAKYPVDGQQRDIFIFKEGSIVFWNFNQVEAKTIMDFLKRFEENSYNNTMVKEEVEVMEYEFYNGKSRISNGKVLLSDATNTGQLGGQGDTLEKYAVSNGIALSVKLAIWEATLEEFVASIECVLEDIKRGREVSLTRKYIFKKTGELFALRHHLNLSSDLLDTPDFYWDRSDLEVLFNKTAKQYSIDRRTRVMNEKIQHCQELMELISHHLEDKHHVRLELMIIILIVVEVIFEIIHYVERYSQSSE